MADDGKQAKNRVPFTKTVQVTAGETVAGKGVDVGGGGICAMLPKAFKTGDEFKVAVEGGPTSQGTVRWCKPEGGSWKVGIQIAAGDWAALAAFAGVPE